MQNETLALLLHRDIRMDKV